MFRRLTTAERFAWLPAALVAAATASCSAGEPPVLPLARPLPALPGQSPVYLSPSSAKSTPSGSRPAPRSSRIVPTAGTRTAQSGDDTMRPQGGLVPPVRKSVVADTAETDRRVERLKKQLDSLHELLARPPVEPPVVESIVNPPKDEEPVAPQPVAPVVPEKLPEPVKPVPTPRPPVPAEPPLHEEHSVSEPATKPARAEKTGLSASGLIKGLPVAAIDRVYVADNLFAAGEYMLANEIYEQVDRKAISQDEAGWVEFQLANCSRRLGRIDDAKKRYRRVVADPTLGWLQDMAKWRLDAIDEREQLVKEHARLEAAIRAMSETSHAPAKP